VLLEKNEKNMEQPITFMRKALRDLELKLSIMEKQAYGLVKYLKHFRSCVGYPKIIVYVPHSVVKHILIQRDFLGISGKWLSNT
jgi:hypothetical protein